MHVSSSNSVFKTIIPLQPTPFLECSEKRLSYDDYCISIVHHSFFWFWLQPESILLIELLIFIFILVSNQVRQVINSYFSILWKNIIPLDICPHLFQIGLLFLPKVLWKSLTRVLVIRTVTGCHKTVWVIVIGPLALLGLMLRFRVESWRKRSIHIIAIVFHIWYMFHSICLCGFP